MLSTEIMSIYFILFMWNAARVASALCISLSEFMAPSIAFGLNHPRQKNSLSALVIKVHVGLICIIYAEVVEFDAVFSGE
jgi:hypothetical protein